MAQQFYTDNMTVEQILAIDPAEMAHLNAREISRALRTVALAANKRVNRLLKYAKKTKHGYVPKPSGGKSIAVDALNWVTSDGTAPAKFGVRSAGTRNQMISQIGKIRQFMDMSTSKVTGAVKVRKAREKNVFGKTREEAAKGQSERQKQRTYKNFQQMYDFTWSSYHKYRELKHQDPHAYYEDSMRVIQMLAQAILNGTSEDEAVSQTINNMNQEYEEQQMQYNDLFGDDFTDFGNFDV